jgi:hypothetical protein
MKLKHFAAAAALLGAGSAFAGITTGNDPKIFGLVWQDSGGTYAVDFNMTVSQLLIQNGPVTLGTTAGSADWASYIAQDANLNDFNGLDGTRWAIIAVDADGSIFDGDDSVKYYTTVGGNTPPAMASDTLGQTISSVGLDYAVQLNFNGIGTNPAQGGDLFAPNNTPADFAEFIQGGAFGLFAGNAVGSTGVKWFETTPRAASTGDPFAAAVFTRMGAEFSFNGTEFTAVVAVPEPETYALLLAGMAAVGFTVRRRRQG